MSGSKWPGGIGKCQNRPWKKIHNNATKYHNPSEV